MSTVTLELAEQLYAAVCDTEIPPLERLLASQQLRFALREAQRDFVRSARGRGDSWAAIGDALGVTRQAAHERFGDGVRHG